MVLFATMLYICFQVRPFKTIVMSLKIVFKPVKLLLLCTLVLVSATVFAGDSDSQGNSVTAIEWLSNNWPAIALVISEIAAFLPTKVSGIVQGTVKGLSAVFSAIFGKNKD